MRKVESAESRWLDVRGGEECSHVLHTKGVCGASTRAANETGAFDANCFAVSDSVMS